MKKPFKVRGQVFVPMQAEIVVEAETADAAMRKANTSLKNKPLGDIIVPNSADERAAFHFEALDAEEI